MTEHLSESSFKVLFQETFDNNQAHWVEMDSREAYLSVEGGKYLINYNPGIFQTKSFLSYIPIQLNDEKDFSITSKMAWKEGAQNYGFGIVWGAKDLSNWYALLISSDGRYFYGMCKNDHIMKIIDWTANSIINKYNNKLKVIKNGSKIKFEINGHLATTASFYPFMGDKVGLSLATK